MHQIIRCGIGQECGLHDIQVYKVVGSVHQENFVF